MPEAARDRLFEPPAHRVDRLRIFPRDKCRDDRIAEISLIKPLETAAIDGPRRRRKRERRVDALRHLGGAPEAVPHLPFDPARIRGASVNDPRAFLLQRANARRFGYAGIAVIKRDAGVSGCGGSGGKPAFVRGEIATRQQIDLAVILNMDERVRRLDATFKRVAGCRRRRLASVGLI